MATNVTDRLEMRVERAGRSPWAKGVARAGLAARGVIYCVVAAIAIQFVLSGGGRVDRQGALKAVADEPLGRALLVVLAAGFACFAVWRFLRAAVGAGEGSKHESGAAGVIKRLGDVAKGLIYVGALYSTVHVLVTSRPEGGTDHEAKTWSARLMTHEVGRWLVIAGGAVLIVVGVVLVVRALRMKFEKHLDMSDMSPRQRTWLPRLGFFGYAARGVVAGAIGVFIIQAGVTFQPQRAVGIDGAIKRLAEASYGPAVVLVLAFGLLSFGLFSFVEARFRPVLEG